MTDDASMMLRPCVDRSFVMTPPKTSLPRSRGLSLWAGPVSGGLASVGRGRSLSAGRAGCQRLRSMLLKRSRVKPSFAGTTVRIHATKN